MTNLFGIGALGLNFTGAKTASVTIAPSDWSNNTCTKTVTGMTPNLSVILAPRAEYMDEYQESDIRCTEQGTDSITFTCATVPATSITINILMIATMTEGERLPVGGKVYYIDPAATGTYTFYNASGDQVLAPTVGTDCTGWTYTVTGANRDKYYVYNDNYQSDCRWTYYSNGQAVYEEIPGLSDNIGSGRSNTSIVMNASDGAYVTNDAGGYPTIWYKIKQFNDNVVDGCSDWYVPSSDEAEELRKAITFTVITTSDDPVIMPAGPVTGGNIASDYDGVAHYKDYNDTRTCYPSNTVFLRKKYYSSSQNNAQNTIAWRHNNQHWAANSKHENMNFFAVRSF